MKKFLAATTSAVLLLGGCSEKSTPPPATAGDVPLEGIGETLGTTTAKQNAQNIAVAAASARAAGYAEPWTSKEEAVDAIVQGISVRAGSQMVSFSSGPMESSERPEAMAFLIFDPTPPGSLRFTNEAQP